MASEPRSERWTKGEWRVDGPVYFPNPNVGMWDVEGDTNVCTHCTLYDAHLIAAAPDMAAALAYVEWSAVVHREEGGVEVACPSCGAVQDDGHKVGCKLDAALSKARNDQQGDGG